MRLEDVSAQLRPRGAWEAVDLGFALTRKHIGLLLSSWALTVVPLWLVLCALAWWVPFWVVLLLTWWLKPIYDRVPLFVLSRALFGAAPALRSVVRAWPGMLWRRFGRLVILSRLSSSRSLVMPVVDLEGLAGKAYARRARVLKRHADGTATKLTMFSGLYELALVMGIISLVGMLFWTDRGQAGWWEMLHDSVSVRGVPPGWLLWVLYAVYLVSLTLVELFYVGGGFGLYLDARTNLEGWDVELAFKRLVRRVSKIAAAMWILLSCGQGWAQEIERKGSSPETEARKTAQEVLKRPEFTVYKEQRYVSTRRGGSGGNISVSWLGKMVSGLYYVVLAMLAVGLAMLIYVNRNLFRRGKVVAGATSNIQPRPRTVAGLDVTPESLPSDIVGAARECWNRGEAREALSLLYRGAIIWLVESAQLPIRASDTEADCLRKARYGRTGSVADYFGMLTDRWIAAAYADRPPGRAEMERLMTGWPFARGGSGE